MLTRAAPAINRSLQGLFNQDQLASLMASIGQCGQPLEHRAPVAFSPPAPPSDGSGWNPNDYPDLWPPPGGSNNGDVFVDAPGNGGYRAGDWISNYYGGPNFDLRTTLNQTMNQYFAQNHYAGNTINVAGNTNTTNLTTQNIDARTITTQNIDATTINNITTAPGPSGPQGNRGLDGRDGNAGIPGDAGGKGDAGRDGRDGGIIVVGNQFDPTALWREINELKREIERLKNAMRNATGEVVGLWLVDAEFDADTCSLNTDDFKATPRVNVNIPV